MPYVTDFERRAIEKGLSQGLRDTIQAVLEVRFGRIDVSVLDELKSLSDIAALQAARAVVQKVESVAALQTVWRSASNSELP